MKYLIEYALIMLGITVGAAISAVTLNKEFGIHFILTMAVMLAVVQTIIYIRKKGNLR